MGLPPILPTAGCISREDLPERSLPSVQDLLGNSHSTIFQSVPTIALLPKPSLRTPPVSCAPDQFIRNSSSAEQVGLAQQGCCHPSIDLTQSSTGVNAWNMIGQTPPAPCGNPGLVHMHMSFNVVREAFIFPLPPSQSKWTYKLKHHLILGF